MKKFKLLGFLISFVFLFSGCFPGMPQIQYGNPNSIAGLRNLTPGYGRSTLYNPWNTGFYGNRSFYNGFGPGYSPGFGAWNSPYWGGYGNYGSPFFGFSSFHHHHHH